MIGRESIGAALRAAFTPVPGEPAPPRSRNLRKAIERAESEAQQLTNVILGDGKHFGDVLGDLGKW